MTVEQKQKREQSAVQSFFGQPNSPAYPPLTRESISSQNQETLTVRGLGPWSADQKVIWLDITMNEISRVDVLNSGNLITQ